MISENTDRDNHDQNDPGILPCVVVMAEAHSEEEKITPAILQDLLPDHDRTMTESRPKTHLTDRFSSMSHFLFPIQGSGYSSLRPFSAENETAMMNSVRKNCKPGF